MADILFHPEAQAEYQAAIGWYRSRNPQAAARFEAEVERVLELAAGGPEMFPRYDIDHRFAVLRRYPYSVVYRVMSGQIYVIAVAHSSRAPAYWRGRE